MKAQENHSTASRRGTFSDAVHRLAVDARMLFYALACPLLSEAEIRGPIELPTDYPLTDLHLSVPPASPEPIPEGQNNFSLQFTWSNASNYDVEGVQGEDDVPSCNRTRDSCYVVDAEVRKALLRYRVGLEDDTEVLFRLPLVWRGGGTLDGTVEQFHKLVGVSSGVRGQVEQDQFQIKGQDHDSSFEFDDDGFGIGNFVVGVKKSIHVGESSRTALQAFVSLPTGQGSYGHKGVDVAGTLLHRESYSDFAFYVGGGPVVKSDTTHYGVDYRRIHGEGFATLEYVYNPKLSLLVGVHAATRIVDGIAEHPGTAAYLDTGLKTEIYGLEWEALFRENISSGSGTTDFTLLLGANVGF